MLLVGVTGGIGAGKSLICNIFRILGVPVFDADLQAKRLMREDLSLVGDIKSTFGENAYLPDGSVNRTYLSEKVFQNPVELQKLNQMVHPAVKKDFERWSQGWDSPFVIKEAALLVESGSYKDLDILIVVTAPEKCRIERVLLRDEHRTKKQVEEIIKNQFPEDKKVRLADFLVNNDESHPILAQVLEIHKLIAQRALKIS